MSGFDWFMTAMICGFAGAYYCYRRFLLSTPYMFRAWLWLPAGGVWMLVVGAVCFLGWAA